MRTKVETTMSTAIIRSAVNRRVMLGEIIRGDIDTVTMLESNEAEADAAEQALVRVNCNYFS